MCNVFVEPSELNILYIVVDCNLIYDVGNRLQICTRMAENSTLSGPSQRPGDQKVDQLMSCLLTYWREFRRSSD